MSGGIDGEVIEQLVAILGQDNFHAIEPAGDALGFVHVHGHEFVFLVLNVASGKLIGFVAFLAGDRQEIALQPDPHIKELVEAVGLIPAASHTFGMCQDRLIALIKGAV